MTQTLPGMEETVNNELSRAVEELKKADDELAVAKDHRAQAVEKVVIEMKKMGKDYLKTKINERFYEIEITRTDEKLKFKKVKL